MRIPIGFRAALLAAVPLALAGCAVTPEPREGKVLHLPQGKVVFRVDREYVARVEAVARRNGTRVHWVNPPLRRIEVE